MVIPSTPKTATPPTSQSETQIETTRSKPYTPQQAAFSQNVILTSMASDIIDRRHANGPMRMWRNCGCAELIHHLMPLFTRCDIMNNVTFPSVDVKCTMNNAPQRKVIQREREQHDNPNYQNQWGKNRHALCEWKKRYRRIVGTSHGRHPRQDKTTRHHRKLERETTRQDAWAEKRERANQALLHKDRIILSPPLLISYSAQERNHSKASKFTRKCYSARSTSRK